MLVFTSTVAVLSGLRSVPEAFAGGEGFVISDSSAPTIFSSRVDIGLVDALRSTPNITGASPETFAFSSWNGVPFVVRGRGGGFGELQNISSDRIDLAVPADSIDPNARSAELIGERLLDRLGLTLPTTIALVGSYSSKVEFVNLVGSFNTGTSLDDELLVSNEVARRLSGMRENEVSIIRVSTSDPDWLAELLSPKSARFTLFDLHVSKALATAGEALDVSVSVRNWGGSTGGTTVMIDANGSLPLSQTVILNSSSSTTVTKQVSFQDLGRHTIRASISGDFPVRLFTNVTIVEPYLRVAAPSKVLLGSLFNATVTDHLGSPVEDSTVGFGTQSVLTDPQGRAALNASGTGTFQVIADKSGYLSGRATVTVADPASFPSTFNASVVSFSLSPEAIDESEAATGVVVIENSGTVAGTYQLVVYVDSQMHRTTAVYLDGLSSATIRFELEDLSPGTHFVQVGSFSVSLAVQPWFADNPGLVQLVIRYGGETSLSSAGAIPIYQAAKISEGNVAVALFAIGSISGLLAVLAIAAVFSKEIHEGRRRLGVLRTIGASRSAVRRLVFPQALENGLAGAAIGVALGILAADTLSKSGAFMVFGHEMVLELDTVLLVLVLLGAAAIGVTTALLSSMFAVRETAISSIRRLEPQATPPLDVDELLEGQ